MPRLSPSPLSEKWLGLFLTFSEELYSVYNHFIYFPAFLSLIKRRGLRRSSKLFVFQKLKKLSGSWIKQLWHSFLIRKTEPRRTLTGYLLSMHCVSITIF
jgi:hypothetical protein